MPNEPTFSGRARRAFAVYLRPQVLVIALLGFSAGLPLALSGATLSVWMADSGVSLETIGLLSLAGLPYTFKFLWAPLVDTVDPPLLRRWPGRQLGRRRGWLVFSQLCLMAAIVYLGTRDPIASPWAIGLGALMVAAASATQDIVIDAYRVESLAAGEQAAGMAGYVAAYRIGMLASSAGVLAVTAWLELSGVPKQAAWSLGYGLAAALVVVGMVATRLGALPRVEQRSGLGDSAARRIAASAVTAFTEFLGRGGALATLAFVVLFKLCDALAGAMTGPFVLALGYDKLTYAGIVKGVGLAASLAGGFAGGLLAGALTMRRALWLGAALQMASNLAFVWLAGVAPTAGALAFAIVIENFTGGIGTVIFVAYLSALCQSPAHTATQYALLTALASVGRTLFASSAGYAAAALGWPLFFLATTAAALPSLLVLAWLGARGHLAELTLSVPAGDERD